jgi:hypothetical protein
MKFIGKILKQAFQVGREREDAWSDFAAEHRGIYLEGDLFNPNKIVIHRDGVQARIDALTRETVTYVRITIVLPVRMESYFVVRPRTFWDRMVSFVSYRPSVADRALDAHFSFITNNAARMRQVLLKEDVRNFLLQDTFLIINMGRVLRTRVPPRPQADFLLETSDIRERDKLTEYFRFAQRLVLDYGSST